MVEASSVVRPVVECGVCPCDVGKGTWPRRDSWRPRCSASPRDRQGSMTRMMVGSSQDNNTIVLRSRPTTSKRQRNYPIVTVIYTQQKFNSAHHPNHSLSALTRAGLISGYLVKNVMRRAVRRGGGTALLIPPRCKMSRKRMRKNFNKWKRILNLYVCNIVVDVDVDVGNLGNLLMTIVVPCERKASCYVPPLLLLRPMYGAAHRFCTLSLSHILPASVH
jgi:hypothetical protein